MKPELRSLLPSDGDDLSEVEPESVLEFGEYLSASVGPAGGTGEDLFDFLVCTPSWIESQQLTKGFRWGHGLLLVDRWDVDTIERAISDLVTHVERETWAEISEVLSRYMRSEFADYRE